MSQYIDLIKKNIGLRFKYRWRFNLIIPNRKIAIQGEGVLPIVRFSINFKLFLMLASGGLYFTVLHLLMPTMAHISYTTYNPLKM